MVTLTTLAIPARGSLIVNGNFQTFTGTATNPFVYSATTGQQLANWTGSVAGMASGSYPGLVCVESAASTNPFCGYAKFGTTPGASPDGGNYVMFDSDPKNTATISQTITGLTVGQKYLLSFYQAATYQTTYTGVKNQQFQVTFGTQTLTATSPNPTTTSSGWQLVNLIFTATSTSQSLTFAAIVPPGTPSGLPPVLLLDGVNLTTPEPATWMTMGLGGALLIALGMIGRKQAPEPAPVKHEVGG